MMERDKGYLDELYYVNSCTRKHVQRHHDGACNMHTHTHGNSQSRPACLPVGRPVNLPGWCDDVALCLLLRSNTSCLCIMQQRTKPDQAIFSRCTLFIRVNVERMDPSPYD